MALWFRRSLKAPVEEPIETEPKLLVRPKSFDDTKVRLLENLAVMSQKDQTPVEVSASTNGIAVFDQSTDATTSHFMGVLRKRFPIATLLALDFGSQDMVLASELNSIEGVAGFWTGDKLISQPGCDLPLTRQIVCSNDLHNLPDKRFHFITGRGFEGTQAGLPGVFSAVYRVLAQGGIAVFDSTHILSDQSVLDNLSAELTQRMSFAPQHVLLEKPLPPKDKSRDW
ncbi:MAG: hypothetical protein KKD39_08735, partial [Candidatus Altiarchaeota archaeon]|nr:hypothetical protein [Candidatus Altiarchaeota archaeon]